MLLKRGRSAIEKEKPAERELLTAGVVGESGFEPLKSIDDRFTVCSLWPLGNSPILNFGAGGRIRTPDLLITNQLLYQLSYTSS